jgi:transcription-repair coupling factor (superfamily II helicase)
VATSTSLNLRAVLKTALARSGMDIPAAAVSGLTPPAKALFVAGAASAQPHGVVLYVVPTDAVIEEAVADIDFFLSAIEGLGPLDRGVLPFPSNEIDPYRGLAPHVGVTSARARALHAIATGATRVVVASAAALLPRSTAPAKLLASTIDLKPGQDIAPADLAELLVDAGFTREDPADQHGEFAVRGGIVDIFPAGASNPVRLEFIGDTIETIRTYDPATQRSIKPIDQVQVVPLQDVLNDRSATIFDYLKRARASRVVVSERDEVDAAAAKLVEQVERSYRQAIGESDGDGGKESPIVSAEEWAELSAEDDPEMMSERAELKIRRVAAAPNPAPQGGKERKPRDSAARGIVCRLDRYRRPPRDCNHDLAAWSRGIARGSMPADRGNARPLSGLGRSRSSVPMTRMKRHCSLLPRQAEPSARSNYSRSTDVFAIPVERAEDAQYAAVLVAVGGLSRGFRLPDAGLQIYAEPDVFEEDRRAPEKRRSATKAFLSDLRDLKVGDLIVHVDHGIGVFVGLKQIGVAGSTGPADDRQEFLELRYAGDDKLFVPVERLDLVQKYTGATKPPIDRLGGTSWERAKTKVKKAMRDMAEELLKLYAARKAVPGHAFSTDSHWQQEFEDAFEYDLTPDQHSSVADIKFDMESPTPMDRLLCGDVGYGKTEVAMRAAFKAVMDGKQVAVLAPTTVLAFQHQKTLKERFAGFPVRIDMVSRFRSKQEQKEVVADLAAGKVDIIVGTHRLLSKDVQFRDLGLLVVDEEQRFGVGHKEKIKQMRKKVDVLTMSATPIPRTLNMSLVGIRDMSIIETPPKDRLSIQTNVVKFDQAVIGRAVRNELARGGQVYFVHNRVESIFSIGTLLQRLVPEARIVIGHGKMAEEQLEKAMLEFIARKHDVLLATTIVENGLDIPNANTIIINRADRYGLSQLYQLRGRVGRSDRPAYAYLLIPPEDNLSPIAKKRLAAIKEFSDLGSGFRVAALDLELRGAGNLLGGEQSGQIDAVGFEMYTKLLEQTVRELKGEEIEDDHRATVNLKVDLRIDESYVPDMNQRLMLYKKVAAARTDEEIDRVLEEATDRYGPLPASVLNLADYGRIRVMADRLGIDSIDREGRLVVLKFRPQAKLDPVRLLTFVRERSELTVAPPSGLKLSLDGTGDLGTKGLGQSPAPQSPIPTGERPKGASPSRATPPRGGPRGHGKPK